MFLGWLWNQPAICRGLGHDARCFAVGVFVEADPDLAVFADGRFGRHVEAAPTDDRADVGEWTVFVLAVGSHVNVGVLVALQVIAPFAAAEVAVC